MPAPPSPRSNQWEVFPPDSTGRYLIDWLDSRRSLRPSTRLSYEIHLRRYLLPHLGMLPLDELSVKDIEAMHDRLLEPPGEGRPLSAATVRRVHATLTSAFNHAVRRGLIPMSPAAFVDLPRATRPELTIWDRGELNTFLLGSRSHRLWALFTLMAFTGLRRGEAVGLRWRDVDLVAGVARIEQQIVWLPGSSTSGPPKTSSGRRAVALAAQVVHALRWQAARQAQEKASARGAWIDTGLVFTQPTGAALNPLHVTREFDRLLSGLDVPRIRLHDLRHTSASLGLASGESLLEVSRRLGHASITITADVYSHVSPVTASAAAERLATLLGESALQPTESPDTDQRH